MKKNKRAIKKHTIFLTNVSYFVEEQGAPIQLIQFHLIDPIPTMMKSIVKLDLVDLVLLAMPEIF
jgi:hypothetical protein